MKLELDIHAAQNQNMSQDSVPSGNFASFDAEETKKLLRSGINLAKEGNRHEARAILLQVTELEPENETAWLWLASISEYPEELLVFLQNVLKTNPNNERAIEWVKQTKTLLSKTFVQRGIDATHQNQKEFSKQCFLQAIVHDENNEMAWLWLASSTDSIEEKCSYFQKVLHINPNNETAIQSLKSLKNQIAAPLLKKANAEVVSGNREQAKQHIEEVMKISPDFDEAWVLKAYLTDDFFQKISYYEKALELNSANEAAKSGLASLKSLAPSHRISDELESPLTVQDTRVEEKFDNPQFTTENNAKSNFVTAESEQNNVNNQTELLENINPFHLSAEPFNETEELLSDVFEEKSDENFSQDFEFQQTQTTSATPQQELADFQTNKPESPQKSHYVDYSESANQIETEKSNHHEFVQDVESNAVSNSAQVNYQQSSVVAEIENFASIDDFENTETAYLAQENLFNSSQLAQSENQDFEIVQTIADDSTNIESAEQNFQHESNTESKDGSFNGSLTEALDNSFVLSFNKQTQSQFSSLEQNQVLEESVAEMVDETEMEHQQLTEENLNKIQTQYELQQQEQTATSEYQPSEEINKEPDFADYQQPTEALSYSNLSAFSDPNADTVTELSHPEKFPNSFQDNYREPIKEDFPSQQEEEINESVAAPVSEQKAEEQPLIQTTMVCPFCLGNNHNDAVVCGECHSVLSTSELEMMLNNHDANQDVLINAIEKMEVERNIREFGTEELTNLGIAHLNANNLQKGYKYLKEASELNPTDIKLASMITALTARLTEPDNYAENVQSHPIQSKTIMVVDDSPTVRKLISGKLEKSGHSVISAVDGMDALAKINEVIPDLILLDITMPRMDGYQVCKLIRNNEAIKDIPIVMISGKDGFFDKVRGRMAGSSGYITKPFGPDTLMKTIETYLA